MKGEKNSKQNRSALRDNGLIDVVFSWSLEDVLNEHLYKTQVEKLPNSFESVQHYLGSYRVPLLEEVRADLSSNLSVISRAPFAEVISIEESKPHGMLSYDIKLDSWSNRSSNQSKEPYSPLPGDIFAISDIKPESVSDLRKKGEVWTLGWIPKIQGNGCSTFLKLKASKHIEVGDQTKKSLFIIFLVNTIPNNRIWKSLHFSGNFNIIEKILCSHSMVEEVCDRCSLNSNKVCHGKLGSKLSSSLNESQRAAILCSICKLNCKHKSSVELMWGPPGTGKTKTLSTLLCAVLGMNHRVLICAPTNVAITGVASCVLKLLKESSEAKCQSGLQTCSLGDLLIFGNQEKLKVDSELEKVFLDYRIETLVECLGPLTGWEHSFTLMTEFLEGCMTQYQAFKDSQSKKKKRKEGSFHLFARDKFKSVALPLRGCVQNLCIHIPRSFIRKHNFQNMEYLLQLLEFFECLLSRENGVSDELVKLCSSQDQLEDSLVDLRSLPSLKNVDLNSLDPTMYISYFLCFRNQCLSILKSLQLSLSHLKLPGVSKHAVKMFCFQRASLIFCTASSSFKLYSMKIEPLNLLVVDEAAQMKECESAIPLQIPGIRHAILIGDECQLPATVISKVSDEAGFGRSLFERLTSLGHSKHLLNIQYRMQPSISFFPNSKFYANQILDGPNVISASHIKNYLPGSIFGSYSFINISSGKEERDEVGYSKKNMVEVAVVIKIVQKLYKAWNGSGMKLSIGIVSPYTAQVVAIQEKLGRCYEKCGGFTAKVKSIDGFQGREEDIIILSTVRSNSSGSIGFMSNPQRINVALTRARHCLWILGNGITLTKSKSIWESVVTDAIHRQCYFHADEDKDLANAIVEVKEKLLQFDDMLSRDSFLFSRARWKILFSDSFRKSVLKLKSKTTKSVIMLLLRLSSGWRPTKDDKNSCRRSSLQILKQFKVEGMHIICTVDIDLESKYIQVLKVWDILPSKDILILIQSLHHLLGMYSDDFLNHCKVKCLEGDYEVPMTWSADHDIVRYKNLGETNSERESSTEAIDEINLESSTMYETLLQMKFYSLSYLRVSQLLSGRDGEEFDIPYQVSDQQLGIIQFPGSTFVIGRPGIEKNIALATKLFQRERQKYMCPEGFNGVRKQQNKVGDSIEQNDSLLCQLFVTDTPKQCLAVKKHVSYLKRVACGEHLGEESSSIDGMHEVDGITQFMDIPDNFVDVPLTAYPLVITFRKFLIMLDGSVGISFFERFNMLWGLSNGKMRCSRTIPIQTYIRMKEVNYRRFISYYWPQFNSLMKKKLDASTTFVEITSHIKGGFRAGKVQYGIFSRFDYVQLSNDPMSTLNRKKRERIYDLFLDYESKKIENGEYDLADLVIDLRYRLTHKSYEGQEMHYVYIDEVQNLTMGQISLFKYVCRNVSDGFVFSADTAATIARGAKFRFEDIRFLFYKEFASNLRDENDKAVCHISDIMHLSDNLRIHPGVLKLAQSVVDLLFCFFPHLVDILCPETSDARVPRRKSAIYLQPRKDENAFITIFRNSENSGEINEGFGAEQVIVVRDDLTRTEIADIVGKHAIVLTIVECQGLEFQDVLLYNFFSSSPLKNQWRVIYKYMKEQGLLDVSPGCSPCFDMAKHIGLCSELKQLYMAITRSRERLWICEDSEELSKPMFDYWKKLCLIEVRELDDCLVHEMKVVSNVEEWKSQGLKLYHEGNYEMAELCFERAGDKHKEKWAKAAGLHIAGVQICASNPEMANYIISEAAETLHSIGCAEHAAQCYIELKEYVKAGAIFMDTYGSSRLEDAGDCFFLAERYKLATEAYAKGKHFLKLLFVCSSVKSFDIGLQYIHNWRQQHLPGIEIVNQSHELEKFVYVFLEDGALHYHGLNDKSTMMKFVKDFHSLNSKRIFLKNIDCLDELLVLEQELGNFTEAATIAKIKGDILLEVDLLEKDGQYKEACTLLLFNVFANSLWMSGNKGWPLKHFRGKEEHLKKAKLFALNVNDDFFEFVCTEVNILLDKASVLSELQVHLCDSQRQKNPRGIILSSWGLLYSHLHSSTSDYQWEDKPVTDSKKYLEEKISQNHVSVETLVYYWNLWKDETGEVINYLLFPETAGPVKCMGYEDFCLSYFGLRKQVDDQNITYLLVNADAAWATEIDLGSLQRIGNLISLDAQKFIEAASSYWFSEVISMGTKVLEKLRALHMFSVRNSVPIFCQCMSLIHIFEVIKYFTESKFYESSIGNEKMKKIIELGLQSILFWKQHDTTDLGVFKIHQEVHDITHSFLMKWAIHYHKLQDDLTMLKFVRAFQSMDSKRSFLKNLSCLNELMVLEVESGNFTEAATIAKLKGDLLVEADLLDKAGDHVDASLLLLSYVLANSLWANGSNGWPLKPFKRKDKLLSKAKSYAKSGSDILHEITCAEATILSNQVCSLLLLKQVFSSFQKHNNLRGRILTARRILDVHLQLDILKYEWEDGLVAVLKKHPETAASLNHVSVETLVYFWNFWKDNIVHVFEYLCIIESQDSVQVTSYGEFCLSYLGVRKRLNDQHIVYHLLNSDAVWARRHNGTLQRNEGLVVMDVSQFVFAARSYWFSEVFSVGLKILEYLKAFYTFSVRNSFSALCQSMAAVHFFEVLKFLTGSKFFKTSSAETSQKFFNIGQEFINFHKKHVSSDVCAVNSCQQIGETEHVFLVKCAVHFHEHRDKGTMMEFVKSFHSMECKRFFLKNLEYYDELLLLEEESGNFTEAITIARMKGDLFLEVDLLKKANRLKEAAMLILWYVLANSLWAHGNKGWPMKQFMQKEELLQKAKSFAKEHSVAFYDYACIESNILLEEENSFLVLKQNVSDSRRYNNLTSEILSARKILDAHFCWSVTSYDWESELIIDLMKHSEDKLSCNMVSAETLFYSWNFWKEKIVTVIEYLECLKTHDVNEYLSYDEFCLRYFGVRRQFDNQNMYQLLNPKADWVIISDRGSLQKDGKMFTMDSRCFSFSAREYWCKELLSVGMRVLETLSALHEFFVNNSFNLFCRTMISARIFEVARCLIGFKFSNPSPDDARLQAYLESSTGFFFANVFFIDWTKSITKSMIDLRRTTISCDLLCEFISKIVRSGNKLTYGQVGRIVMAMFGCGKPSSSLYETIEEEIDGYPPWKSFVSCLRRQMVELPKLFVANEVIEPLWKVSPTLLLHEALKDTYHAFWREEFDYISPDHFLHIVEHHLISVSYLEGCCYTSRSSFVEWILYEEWINRPRVSLLPRMEAEGIYSFIADMVHKLLMKKCNTMKWIQRCNIKSKEYYPLLVLRLVILMCLLCVNSGKHFDKLANLLGVSDIRSQLPGEFCDVLRGRKKLQYNFIRALSEALNKIQNPLVIVSSGKHCQNSHCPDAIVINMSNTQNRENILKVLFSRNVNDVQDKTGAGGHISRSNSNQGKGCNTPSSLSFSVTEWIMNIGIDGGDGQLIKSCERSLGILESLKSLEVEYDINAGRFMPDTQITKLKLEKSICILNDLVSQSIPKGSARAKCKNIVIAEANSMIEEMKKLSVALDMSDPELKNNRSKIGKLHKNVQSRIQKLEPLLNVLISEKGANVGDASMSTISSKVLKNKIEGKRYAKENSGSKKAKTKWEQKAAKIGSGNVTQMGEASQSIDVSELPKEKLEINSNANMSDSKKANMKVSHCKSPMVWEYKAETTVVRQKDAHVGEACQSIVGSEFLHKRTDVKKIAKENSDSKKVHVKNSHCKPSVALEPKGVATLDLENDMHVRKTSKSIIASEENSDLKKVQMTGSYCKPSMVWEPKAVPSIGLQDDTRVEASSHNIIASEFPKNNIDVIPNAKAVMWEPKSATTLVLRDGATVGETSQSKASENKIYKNNAKENIDAKKVKMKGSHCKLPVAHKPEAGISLVLQNDDVEVACRSIAVSEFHKNKVEVNNAKKSGDKNVQSKLAVIMEQNEPTTRVVQNYIHEGGSTPGINDVNSSNAQEQNDVKNLKMNGSHSDQTKVLEPEAVSTGFSKMIQMLERPFRALFGIHNEQDDGKMQCEEKTVI